MVAEAHPRSRLTRVTLIAIAASSLFLTSVPALAQSTVAVSPTSVGPGGVITVTITNGPGNAHDWVALFPTNASDTGYLDWLFLNGTRFNSTSGLTSATLTFTMPATPGSYNFRFFVNDTYVRLATSTSVTVGSPPITTPTLTVSPTTVTGGGVVSVVVANGTGNAHDWIGLFAAGAADSSYSDWRYLNNARVAPSTGPVNATVTFAMPTMPGTYEVRLFANDTYSRLATSAPVTVSAPTVVAPSLVISPTAVTPGAVVTVSLSNGPGNAHDWLALVADTASDSAYSDWKYLNNSRVAPATGLVNATVTFTMPPTPGNYNVRFFANDTFARLAVSVSVSVTAPAIVGPSVTVSPTTISGGGVVSVSVSNASGNARDWLGLVPASGPDSSYSDWKYLNNSRVAPAGGLVNAIVTFTMPPMPGAYNVRLFANDTMVRLATSATITVADTTAPVISSVTASTNASGAVVTWSTNEASDSQVDYGLSTAYGTSTLLNPTSATAHSVVLSGLAAMTQYHYRVKSRDAAGNLGVSTDFAFTTPDAIAPTVSITAPSSGATVVGSVTISASANDNVGVVGVQFLLDGVPLGVEDSSTPYALVWDTSASSQGLHTLTAVARDGAGNQATSVPVSVTTSNPTVQFTFAWNPNPEVDVAGYKIYYGTSSAAYTSSINVGKVTTCTIAGLQPGTLYYFAATAYNATGTESAFSSEVTGLK